MRLLCKRITLIGIAAALLLLSGGTAAAAAPIAPDVPANAWYHDDVAWALRDGCMTGYSNGSFGPKDVLTRGQFAAILYRLAKEPPVYYSGGFSDIGKGRYYAAAVLWASGQGILTGYDQSRFGPDDPITREQLAVILFRYAKYAGAEVRKTGNLTDYADGKTVAVYAKNGVAYAVAAGLLQGDRDGKLNPKGIATRGEIAAVLHRFTAALQEGKDSGELVVCIDPGHYHNATVLSCEDGSTYCEGDVTLEIAQALQQILREKYGISSYLTRTTGDILIDGHKNGNLDGAYLRLRGELARDANLFVSIHTNGNSENANGLPTCSQPLALNKPLLLLNTVGSYDSKVLDAANYVGLNLDAANAGMDLSCVSGFQTVPSGSALTEWTLSYNDKLGQPGTVLLRTTRTGEDYYGVLRGASNVGTPGFIIEHGYHTVPQVRAGIADDMLISLWASADAAGIAKAFGVTAKYR